MSVKLYQGDCLELMPSIEDKSIDMILCDLPYGTTQNKWDKVIPLEPLFKEYNRIIKDNGAIVLFAQQPFETDLINANRKYFRYEWIWDKKAPVGFLNANRMPLRRHENLVVFYKHLPTYNPQYWYSKSYKIQKNGNAHMSKNYDASKFLYSTDNPTGKRYPCSILSDIPQVRQPFGYSKEIIHPTQKPAALCEYLIKTYTNEGETVLDNCMGSGSTGVACVNTGRNFIGMELDKDYFCKAKERIESS